VLLLVAAQVVLVWIAPSLAGAKPVAVREVLPLIALLSVPAGLALMVAPRVRLLPPSRVAMAVMIGAGLVMRLVWFGAAAPLEDDFYRYLWDGATVAAGGNPYLVAPALVEGTQGLAAMGLAAKGLAAKGLAAKVLGAEVLARINFPELTTIYPGVAQAVFAVAHVIAPWKLDGLRAVFLAADLAGLWVLIALLGRLGQSPLLAGLYWLNPLVVFAIFGAGHVDGVLVPLLLGAVLAVSSAWPVTAAGLLALAVGVKIWPVVLAPLVFAQIWRGRQSVGIAAAVFVVICASVLGPLVVASFGRAALGASGLAAYASDWANNNGPFAWASYGLYLLAGESPAAQLALRGAVAAGVGAVAIWAALQPVVRVERLAELALLVTACLFYLQPAQFPWYALGFLPFAVVTRCWPLLLPSVTLPAYYLFFPLWNSGQGDAFRYGVAFVHAVPVWGWLLVLWWRVQRCDDPSIEAVPV
ncbi:MAG: glycosyltransferase 87 family protein, partial [Hyphomicrobiaceae bacterium]